MSIFDNHSALNHFLIGRKIAQTANPTYINDYDEVKGKSKKQYSKNYKKEEKQKKKETIKQLEGFRIIPEVNDLLNDCKKLTSRKIEKEVELIIKNYQSK